MEKSTLRRKYRKLLFDRKDFLGYERQLQCFKIEANHRFSKSYMSHHREILKSENLNIKKRNGFYAPFLRYSNNHQIQGNLIVAKFKYRFKDQLILPGFLLMTTIMHAIVFYTTYKDCLNVEKQKRSFSWHSVLLSL